MEWPSRAQLSHDPSSRAPVLALIEDLENAFLALRPVEPYRSTVRILDREAKPRINEVHRRLIMLPPGHVPTAELAIVNDELAKLARFLRVKTVCENFGEDIQWAEIAVVNLQTKVSRS